MRQLLEQNNFDLLNEVKRIELSLSRREATLAPELNDFHSWLLARCDALKTRLIDNLSDLDRNLDRILVDILSNTNVLTREVYELNLFFLNPVLRTSEYDHFCLKMLSWLHLEHPKTAKHLFAMSDGSFASLPYPPYPTIFFVPPSSQGRLLYIPLLFHEFGHLLYAFHKEELDCLVKELQLEIVRILQPSVQRNDAYSIDESKWRSIVSEIWYEWAQEIFCDAVGLTVGGPSFLYSFSMYFRMLGREELQVPKESLRGRTHPVTWLRIKILANRAQQMGLVQEASQLLNAWEKIARYSNVVEDYFGFYTDEFLPHIQSKITDMLVESSPRSYLADEIGEDPETLSSPIVLLNSAWHQFHRNPEEYNSWEEEAIRGYLEADLSLGRNRVTIAGL